jgi:NDMA-dependent alcohol dehydrogenase
MKTKAALMVERNHPLEIEEIDLEGPHENEVLIRFVASGICHSDLSALNGTIASPVPIVLGHEGAGVVEEVGPGVTHVAPGDHVIAVLTPTCGKCPMCQEGKPFLCREIGRLMAKGTMVDGTTRFRRNGEGVPQLCGVGSFSERSVIPAGSAIKVGGNAPLESVCLIGCGVTTGVGAAVNTAEVKPGTSVAVIGCGGVGLSIIQGARINGATTIIAIDPVAEKRDLALRLGATDVIDPTAEDPIKGVRQRSGKLGVHYAFEALGRIDTVRQAWDMVRPTGRAVIVGVASFKDSFPLMPAGLLSERRITGSAYGSAVPARDIPRFVSWYLDGRLKLDEMITKRIRLEDVNQALDEMRRGEGARSVIMYN